MSRYYQTDEEKRGYEAFKEHNGWNSRYDGGYDYEKGWDEAVREERREQEREEERKTEERMEEEREERARHESWVRSQAEEEIEFGVVDEEEIEEAPPTQFTEEELKEIEKNG